MQRMVPNIVFPKEEPSFGKGACTERKMTERMSIEKEDSSGIEWLASVKLAICYSPYEFVEILSSSVTEKGSRAESTDRGCSTLLGGSDSSSYSRHAEPIKSKSPGVVQYATCSVYGSTKSES